MASFSLINLLKLPALHLIATLAIISAQRPIKTKSELCAFWSGSFVAKLIFFFPEIHIRKCIVFLF